MSSVLSDALSLFVVLVILLVRPTGLFGGKAARSVAA
jgi:branched-subunit amino acid ABC-type transport system permease component